MSEDKALLLGREDTGKLLRQYALPAIVAMIASSLYNIVDSIFIGQGVGALAISGLALTFPFMNLAAAFGTLVGVGAATLVSIKLGEKDYCSARMILGNVVILGLIFGLSLTVAILPFLSNILYMFGGSEYTVGYAKDYMEIILIGNVFTYLYFGLNAVLRSSGHPQKAMYVTLFAVILNVGLDALFIFVFKWGISGAAWATVIAQLCALLWLVMIFIKRNKVMYFSREIFRLKKKIVIDTCAIGLSPFLMNSAASFVVIIINMGLQKHGGDLAIGAYGIINRVGFIFVMIVLGLTQGMQPIIGYNYGAKLYPRVLEVFRKGVKFGVLVMTIAFVSVELFPDLISRAFTTDQSLIDIAVKGFRIVFCLFPIVGFQIVSSNFFQSIGQAKKSIFLSLIRQVIVLIPLLFILPNFIGINGIWLSMPISDLIATIITAILIIRQINYLKSLSQTFK